MAGYCHRLAFLVDFKMIIAACRSGEGCEVSRRNEWPNVRDLFHFPPISVHRTTHPSTRLWRRAVCAPRNSQGKGGKTGRASRRHEDNKNCANRTTGEGAGGADLAWSTLRVISRPLIICPFLPRTGRIFRPDATVTPLRSAEHRG